MGNTSLVRVGGVCAVLMVVSGIVARIFFGLGDLLTGHWFDVLALVLSMAAALGWRWCMNRRLRRSGALALWGLGGPRSRHEVESPSQVQD